MSKFGGAGRFLLVATLLVGMVGTVSAQKTVIDDFEYSDLSTEWENGNNDGLSFSETQQQQCMKK